MMTPPSTLEFAELLADRPGTPVTSSRLHALGTATSVAAANHTACRFMRRTPVEGTCTWSPDADRPGKCQRSKRHNGWSDGRPSSAALTLLRALIVVVVLRGSPTPVGHEIEYTGGSQIRRVRAVGVDGDDLNLITGHMRDDQPA